MSPELSAPTPPEPSPAGAPRRIVVDGKFFRDGPAKFYVKGVTYGPFAPNERGEPFAGVEETARDFRLLRALGANVLRVYHVPPRWFLDLAPSYGLRVLIDIPWSKHLCFLDSRELCAAARRAVREAAAVGRAHPAVFAYSVVNEIPPDIVRWSGVRRVEGFIEELVEEVRQADPGALCTFTSFPSTEYLEVQNADFACFNVYLHERDALERYLSRLQMLSDTRPLVLGELGMDSIRQGRARQAQFLREQLETVFRGGLAGAVVFSFTDDWHRGGAQITDWAFGLTTAERVPKESFEAVRECFEKALVERRGESRRVSMMLVGEQPVGTIVLVHIDTAVRVLEAPEAKLIDDGLDGVAAAMEGRDFDHLFADLIDREPQLPAFLLDPEGLRPPPARPECRRACRWLECPRALRARCFEPRPSVRSSAEILPTPLIAGLRPTVRPVRRRFDAAKFPMKAAFDLFLGGCGSARPSPFSPRGTSA